MTELVNALKSRIMEKMILLNIAIMKVDVLKLETISDVYISRKGVSDVSESNKTIHYMENEMYPHRCHRNIPMLSGRVYQNKMLQLR